MAAVGCGAVVLRYFNDLSVGEIREFDARALVAMQRRRRQLQAAGAASTAAAVALFVAVAFNHDSGGRVAIKTRSDVSDAPPTTGSSLTDGSSTTLDGSTTSSAAPPPTDTTTPVVPTVTGLARRACRRLHRHDHRGPDDGARG